MDKIIVSSLSVYPVKSCREVGMTRSHVEAFGLSNDRRWMVVDEKGVMLTQRKIAKMCLIQPEIKEDGLVLNTSGIECLYVEKPLANKITKVKIWTDYCQVYDAGDKAASWLSYVLSTKCRLVYFPDDEFRQVDINYANKGDKTAFSDGFPLLLISQGSLDDLNQRLSVPVTMSRFRPNIVVNGCQPFAEDSWRKIRIGEIDYRVVKPCSRCVIPTINIETAEREKEPIKTLGSYRKRDNKIFFGQNVIADENGKIEVGMSVEILE